jgi:hypothetical protein
MVSIVSPLSLPVSVSLTEGDILSSDNFLQNQCLELVLVLCIIPETFPSNTQKDINILYCMSVTGSTETVVNVNFPSI